MNGRDTQAANDAFEFSSSFLFYSFFKSEFNQQDTAASLSAALVVLMQNWAFVVG